MKVFKTASNSSQLVFKPDMSQSSIRLCEFGAFRLDAVERVLWRGEEMIALPPKVFDTLWTLIKEEGRIVSKSELMETVWAGSIVEESNLSQNIYMLRRTLGVDGQGRQFIETIPRRGYRFAVPVRLIEEAPKNGPDNSGAPASAQTALSATSGPAEKEIRPRLALRNALFAGLGIVILSAFGFGVYQFFNRRGEKERIAPIEQVRFQRLTDGGDVINPTISPDGAILAFVRIEQEQGSVWIKQIATGGVFQALPPSHKGYRSLAFSPDGQRLFFRNRADPGTVYQTATFGGAQRKVADNVWSDFSLSPDGRQMAFIRRDADRGAQSIILSDIDGGEERELAPRQSSMGYDAIAPAWSPDESKLVAVIESERPKLLTVDISTGEEKELATAPWRAIHKVLWTPDGRHLIFTARAIDEETPQLWMFNYPDGAVRRLTNDLDGYFWISLSGDGRKLVTRRQRLITNLWLLPDGDVRKIRQLTFGERGFDGYKGLAWAPDGRIVFSAFANNFTDLYSMRPDGTDRVQLTANAGQDNVHPAVTTDGRYLVFTSNRAGSRQIWGMDIDGRNQKQLTFGEGQKDSAQYPALSPDGGEVYFIKRAAGTGAIWKVSINGGAPVPVSRLTGASTEDFLLISPDGKWLAYNHVSTDQTPRGENTAQIGVLSTKDGAELRLVALPVGRPLVQWAADSTAFNYAGFNPSRLWRQSLDGAEPQKLCDFPDRIFNMAWSRDGKNLVVSRGEQRGDAILITNLP
jgi:Tol biopolymer transport system component/DNA-binding winged helix-turn-helix (wHTH) protein